MNRPTASVRRPVYGITLALCLSLAALARADEPITGNAFDALTAWVGSDLHAWLTGELGNRADVLVRGPLDPSYEGDAWLSTRLRYIRVVCFSAAICDSAAAPLQGKLGFRIARDPAPLPWAAGTVMADSHADTIWFGAIQQLRWLIWQRSLIAANNDVIDRRRRYAAAVSDYLQQIDSGLPDASPPRAIDFGLPEREDFYAEPPGYVIEGYANYKEYLHDHEGISTDFAHGIRGFIPTDSLRGAMIDSARPVAYPNKERPMLQREFRQFVDRGGDMRVLSTLTRAGFDTLAAGEYFFAVGVDGTVRFGRELLREDVDRMEQETGRKVPRANHAFLFPGEPVLTAGAFFIDRMEDRPRIREVNAQSGHYFYSNISPTVREDIAVGSNAYLLTLGHFFASLERLGIPCDDVLIRKL